MYSEKSSINILMKSKASVTDLELERWKRLIAFADTSGSLVLDVGSGSGYISTAMAEKNEVVALDINYEGLEKIYGTKIMTIAADAVQLPFRDKCFDVIIIGEVLEHIHQDIKALKEAHRTTRKEGHLIISTPNAEALHYMILRNLPDRLIMVILEKMGAELRYHLPLVGIPSYHVRLGYSYGELAKKLEICKFKVLGNDFFGFILPKPVMEKLPHLCYRSFCRLFECRFLKRFASEVCVKAKRLNIAEG